VEFKLKEVLLFVVGLQVHSLMIHDAQTKCQIAYSADVHLRSCFCRIFDVNGKIILLKSTCTFYIGVYLRACACVKSTAHITRGNRPLACGVNVL